MVKIMKNVIILRVNDETKKKLNKLIKELNGLYPSQSQCIRSAIHRLYNEKVVRGELKDDIL